MSSVEHKKINPNIQDSQGMTALMLAAREGFVDGVHTLLDRGADPDIQDTFGYTALIYAAEHGCEEVVQLLLDRGANMGLKRIDGNTAYDMAKNTNIKEMIHSKLLSLIDSTTELYEDVSHIDYKRKNRDTSCVIARYVYRTYKMLYDWLLSFF